MFQPATEMQRNEAARAGDRQGEEVCLFSEKCLHTVNVMEIQALAKYICVHAFIMIRECKPVPHTSRFKAQTQRPGVDSENTPRAGCATQQDALFTTGKYSWVNSYPQLGDVGVIWKEQEMKMDQNTLMISSHGLKYVAFSRCLYLWAHNHLRECLLACAATVHVSLV